MNVNYRKINESILLSTYNTCKTRENMVELEPKLDQIYVQLR